MFEQSKRTGVAVPFRTCILPGFDANDISKKKKLQLGELKERGDSDRQALWQAWPMLTGFSFTGKSSFTVKFCDSVFVYMCSKI